LQASAPIQPNIGKYYLFNFFLNFQLWWPIWIIYLTEQRGLTLAQVTLIDIPFWLCIVLLQVPAAAAADRWGRRPTLIASAAAFAVAITAFGLASTFWLILIAYLIWGVAFSLLNGTESAFIYDSLKALGRDNEYQTIYGRAWAINMAAAVAGTMIGAPLAAATSLPVPIVISGGIAAFAAFTALTFREPPRPASDGARLTYTQVIRQSAEIVRRRPAVRYSILMVGIVAIGSLGPIFFFQPFLVDHGVDTADVGFWQTPMRVAAIFGALAAARIIMTLGERRTFYLMPAVLIASYALLALWGSVYAQAAFLTLNFVMIMSQPLLTDYINRRVPSEQRATVVSLTNLVRSAALIPSAPLMGLLATNVSLSAAFAAGGILVAALALPLLALWSPLMERGDAPEPALAEPAGVSGAGR